MKDNLLYYLGIITGIVISIVSIFIVVLKENLLMVLGIIGGIILVGFSLKELEFKRKLEESS